MSSANQAIITKDQAGNYNVTFHLSEQSLANGSYLQAMQTSSNVNKSNIGVTGKWELGGSRWRYYQNGYVKGQCGAKAHTYNKYPDNHPKNKWVSATASFEVESGIFQTGIAYPKSDNAKNETPFSSKNVDGSSIEFVGRDGIGFDPGDYRLLKIIVLDE